MKRSYKEKEMEEAFFNRTNEAFFASSIPNLQLDGFSVDVHLMYHEGSTIKEQEEKKGGRKKKNRIINNSSLYVLMMCVAG